ncbi:MAG: ATP-binding protein [Symploca sp. SIO2G7]|nr:ATP-binding protein [Symploca sp. SIO2G7]
MTVDRRFELFCSQQSLDVFHPVIHQHQIWHPDPYDVETIHQPARDTYERLGNRIGQDIASDSGRILLLLGEAGAGKTHLMRTFRNQLHEQNKGFFSYMQMTSAVTNYGRYVLRNTIDSFDKPYYQPLGATTGFLKLSNALAEDRQVIRSNELALLQSGDLTKEELLDLLYPAAERVVALERFKGVDLDLVRALRYLQAGRPDINAKVFKLLRCESLTPYDSTMLGGMGPKDQADDPLRMLQSLAYLIQAVTDGALVVCVDQLEDINETRDAGQRFRRAMQTLITLAEVPNVIAIIACLNDFYERLKAHLPKPQLARLELDPDPVKLTAVRTADEIRVIVARRLQTLYESADLFVEADSLYPFPEAIVDHLSGLTTRDILDWCRAQRENSIATQQPP